MATVLTVLKGLGIGASMILSIGVTLVSLFCIWLIPASKPGEPDAFAGLGGFFLLFILAGLAPASVTSMIVAFLLHKKIAIIFSVISLASIVLLLWCAFSPWGT